MPGERKDIMKKIELTDQEISTLLYACSNEFNRTFKRRCEDGKNEHSTAEDRLLKIQDKLYKLLIEQ